MEFSAVNTIWVLVGAALVFFMQAGFAMVETGFTRAKNAGNIIMKNLMDFCIGTPVFWLVGFGLMFGAGNGFIGKIGGIATEAHYGSGMLPDGVPFWAFLIFQTVFCATSATIVSGAMAERTKFLSYCVYSLMISLVVYPVSGHWIWGGGFISQMGFHDFAGSCAVHMVVGDAAHDGAHFGVVVIGVVQPQQVVKGIAAHIGFNVHAHDVADAGHIILGGTVNDAQHSKILRGVAQVVRRTGRNRQKLGNLLHPVNKGFVLGCFGLVRRFCGRGFGRFHCNRVRVLLQGLIRIIFRFHIFGHVRPIQIHRQTSNSL